MGYKWHWPLGNMELGSVSEYAKGLVCRQPMVWQGLPTSQSSPLCLHHPSLARASFEPEKHPAFHIMGPGSAWDLRVLPHFSPAVLWHGLVLAGEGAMASSQSNTLYISHDWPSLMLRKVSISSQLCWYFSPEILAALTEGVSSWCKTFLNLCRIQSLLLNKGRGGAGGVGGVLRGEGRRHTQPGRKYSAGPRQLGCHGWIS